MMVIEKGASVVSIYADIERIHRNAIVYETNFYAGKESIERWISWDQLEVVRTSHVILLLRKSKFSKQVYYFTDDLERLNEALVELTSLEKYLNIDYLGKDNSRKEIFERAGFYHYITLHRMNRFQMDGEDQALGYGEFAVKEDAGQICDILEKVMDLKSDQVPGIQEIEDYIDRKEAIVLREEGTQDIICCILWTRKGKRMEWNYWALNPNYKGTLYSIHLLDAYLMLNGSVKRTTLFVRDRNPARSIYEWYGFQYDGLNDYVYCYRGKGDPAETGAGLNLENCSEEDS